MHRATATVSAGGGFGFGVGGPWDHYRQGLAIRAETDCLVRGARTHGLGQDYRWWHCSYCQHDIREQDLDAHLKKENHILFRVMTSEGVMYDVMWQDENWTGRVPLAAKKLMSPIVQQQALAPVPAKLPPLSFSVSAKPPPPNRVLDEFAVSISSSTFRSVVATFPHDIA